jgi:hypothetical protein
MSKTRALLSKTPPQMARQHPPRAVYRRKQPLCALWLSWRRFALRTCSAHEDLHQPAEPPAAETPIAQADRAEQGAPSGPPPLSPFDPTFPGLVSPRLGGPAPYVDPVLLQARRLGTQPRRPSAARKLRSVVRREDILEELHVAVRLREVPLPRRQKLQSSWE